MVDTNSQDDVYRWETMQRRIKYEETLIDQTTTHINTAKKSIEENTCFYYERKIHTKETYDYYNRHILLKTSDDNEDKKYSIVTEPEKVLGNYYMLIEEYLMALKDDNMIMLKMLKCAKESSYEDMTCLLCNFFYENPFKPSLEQEDLIEIIFHLLQEEIGKLNNPSVDFLDRNFLTKLLKGFSRRQDIKSYLSMVLGEIILTMEASSQQFISMDLDRIISFLKDKNESHRRKTKYCPKDIEIILYDDLTLSRLTLKKMEHFSIKQMNPLLLPPKIVNVDDHIKVGSLYLNPDYLVELNEEEINRRVTTETDPFMKVFYEKQYKRIDNDKDIFTNHKFCEELSNHKGDWQNVVAEYKNSFQKMKYFIDKLISNLLKHESVVPYTIKIICKIIEGLIIKKFPNINMVDKNAFICEFFIGIFLMPILTNPDYNGIIVSSIISQETRRNLLSLTKVLKKIYRGNFFESKHETSYTIFNIYICEILPFVNAIVNKITLVKLPKKIERLITLSSFQGNTINSYSNKLPNDNHLTTNEIFIHQSLSITFNEIYMLYDIINANKEKFKVNFDSNATFYNAYKQFESNENDIFQQKKSRNDEREYIIFSRNTFSNEINEKLDFKKIKYCFTEVDKTDVSKDEMFILSRVKFCIKIILRSLKNLNLQFNHNLESSESTIDFFNNLSKVIQLEDHSHISTNEKIPLGWYSLYLQTHLPLLNHQYLAKDYILLYNEIMTEVDQSIKDLENTSVITKMEDKISYSKRINELIENDYYRTKQIEKFVRIYKFIKNENMPVSIKYFENDPNKIRLKKNPQRKDGAEICKNLNDFPLHYTKLKQVKEDVLSTTQPNKVNEILAQYLSFIQEIIAKHSLFAQYKTEEEIEEIMSDIENYLVVRMYDSIYPREQSKEDAEFEAKCIDLEWIKPIDLEIKTKYINEKLWSIAICYFNRIDIEKTPINKLNCVQSAYKILNNCIIFSAGNKDDAGVDDILPIFIYVIIKAKPKKLVSNMNYIKALIHPNKLFTTYGFIVMQIEMAYNYILMISKDTIKK